MCESRFSKLSHAVLKHKYFSSMFAGEYLCSRFQMPNLSSLTVTKYGIQNMVTPVPINCNKI